MDICGKQLAYLLLTGYPLSLEGWVLQFTVGVLLCLFGGFETEYHYVA